MKKTLALLLSVLMLVSCFAVFASADTAATPVITDGTANATGAPIRTQTVVEHAIGATYVPDGTDWKNHDDASKIRYPEDLWTYGTSTEQLQLDNVSNGVYPTIKVNQADGSTVDLTVYGSRAKLAVPAKLTKFHFTFDTASSGAKNWVYQFDTKVFASADDGETWDVLHAFQAAGQQFSKNYAGVWEVTVTSDKTYTDVAIYTETSQAGLCRLAMIVPFGYTEAEALGAKVVKSYGQVSIGEIDATQTTHLRDFTTQQNIWENTTEVQYQTSNFNTPHTLQLTDGTKVQGYGAAAKLQTLSTVEYYVINRNGGNGTAIDWGQFWDDMTLYGSTDGGITWTAIAKPSEITKSYATFAHWFAIDKEYVNTAFTDLALLTTSAFRIQQIVAYGHPVLSNEGEALTNMKTIDDGNKWVTKNDYIGYDRDPADMWEKDILFQWQSANVFALGRDIPVIKSNRAFSGA